MLQPIRTVLLFFLLSVAVSVTAGEPPFPDLVDVDGKPVRDQADLGGGKWQLIMIWHTDCHVCKKMKPVISEFHDKYKQRNAEVYGVALDGAQNIDLVKQYMIDHDVSFPTYVGELDMISINYEINTESRFAGTPTYMLFNPDGELLAIDFGMLDVDSLERFIDRNS